MNYPIYPNDWNLNQEQLLKYISLFDNYSCEFLQLNKEMFVCYYRYPDGLKIKFTWKIKNKEKFPYLQKIVDGNILKRMMKTGTIKCMKVLTYEFTEVRAEVNNETKKIFNSIIGTNSIKMNDEEYMLLEYNVSQPSFISKNFIEELVDRGRKYLRFEEYYKQENKKE